MINWLKGWKGMAVGAAFIVLSIIYNSVFKTQIANSIPMQIPGYFLIGIGCALVMYAAVSSPASGSKPADTSETDSEEKAETEEDSATPVEEENE